MPTNNPPLTVGDLAGFIGTENWWKHPLFRNYTYTDGVRFVAQKAGAYWLIEAIFSHQIDRKVKRQAFQVWTLKVSADRSAVLRVTDGNSDRPIVEQAIEFTDFPLDEIGFYLADNVLMLKSEY